MKNKVRLAVAGAGAFGREHTKAIAQIADITLVGIADPNRAAAEAAAEGSGAEVFADPAALLDGLSPDGLVVATPGVTHVAIAAAALARNVPVLLEKPVAPSLDEAAALVAAERASTAFVLPGHVLRFSEAHRRLVEIAHSDAVGPILSITARRHRDDTHATRYRDDPVLMTMIHDIDLALWIARTPASGRVNAVRLPAGTSRSATTANVARSDGSAWTLQTAWTFPTTAHPPDRIEVIGENGSVELVAGEAIHVYGRHPATIDISAQSDDAPLVAEDAYFADCIRNGTAPTRLTLSDALAGLAVADAIATSLRTGEMADFA